MDRREMVKGTAAALAALVTGKAAEAAVTPIPGNVKADFAAMTVPMGRIPEKLIKGEPVKEVMWKAKETGRFKPPRITGFPSRQMVERPIQLFDEFKEPYVAKSDEMHKLASLCEPMAMFMDAVKFQEKLIPNFWPDTFFAYYNATIEEKQHSLQHRMDTLLTEAKAKELTRSLVENRGDGEIVRVATPKIHWDPQRVTMLTHYSDMVQLNAMADMLFHDLLRHVALYYGGIFDRANVWVEQRMTSVSLCLHTFVRVDQEVTQRWAAEPRGYIYTYPNGDISFNEPNFVDDPVRGTLGEIIDRVNLRELKAGDPVVYENQICTIHSAEAYCWELKMPDGTIKCKDRDALIGLNLVGLVPQKVLSYSAENGPKFGWAPELAKLD